MRYFQYSSSLWTFHVLKTSKIIAISSITAIICKWLAISCLSSGNSVTSTDCIILYLDILVDLMTSLVQFDSIYIHRCWFQNLFLEKLWNNVWNQPFDTFSTKDQILFTSWLILKLSTYAKIIRLYTHVIILLKGPGRLSRLPTTKSTLGTNKWSIFIKVVLYKYHLYDRSRSYRVWFRGVPSMFWLDTFLMFWYNR